MTKEMEISHLASSCIRLYPIVWPIADLLFHGCEIPNGRDLV